MRVIADPGRLRYLIVIGQVDPLPVLYGSIVLPPGVIDELTQMKAPGSRGTQGRRTGGCATACLRGSFLC